MGGSQHVHGHTQHSQTHSTYLRVDTSQGYFHMLQYSIIRLSYNVIDRLCCIQSRGNTHVKGLVIHTIPP